MRGKHKTFDSVIRTEEREKDGIGYKYKLIMKESLGVASYGIPLYSIDVEMNQGNGKTTSATATDLFADAGRAINFFERIVDNLATPIDLAYIVEDEMS